MKVALITGTRELPSSEQVDELRRVIRACDFAVLGDCPTGIDALAKLLCDRHGVAYDVHLCDWNTESGPDRNARMVSAAVAFKEFGHKVRCFAFPSPRSKGTRNCMRLAREAGIPVRPFPPPRASR